MSDVAALPEDRTAEIEQYWPAVVTCFVTAIFGWGFGFSGISVYLAELQRLHGWSSGLIGSAIAAYYLIGAVCLTRVHGALQWFGARRLLAAGTILLGLGATLFSRSQQPWEMFAAATLMAVGWAGCTSTAIATTLAMYFERQRGLAITLALNGASAAGFTVGPVLVVLSQDIGVGRAVPLAAFGLLAIVLPLIGFGLREPTEAASAVPTSAGPDLSAAYLLRSWRLWSIALPFALALAAQVGLIVELVSFLLPRLGPGGAATALALTSIAAVSGRLALAAVIDRLHQRRASAVSFASQAGGLALMMLLPNQPAALYAGCAIFGLSVGNVITFPALIVQREFPAASFGLVIGLSAAAGQFAFSLTPVFLGMIRDLTGGYIAVLAVCIALQIVASAIVLVGARSGNGLVR